MKDLNTRPSPAAIAYIFRACKIAGMTDVEALVAVIDYFRGDNVTIRFPKRLSDDLSRLKRFFPLRNVEGYRVEDDESPPFWDVDGADGIQQMFTRSVTSSQTHLYMNCLSCAAENEYIFCKRCTPEYGRNVKVRRYSIYVGEISLWGALSDRLSGLIVIKWWVGTDVWMMWAFPPGRGKFSILRHRLKMYLVSFLIHVHWIDGHKLREEFDNLYLAKAQKHVVMLWCGRHGKYPRQDHDGFNVIYYHPGNHEFARYKYGIDIIEQLRVLYPQLNWMSLDGSQDMQLIYPIADLYIRPARHDGFPRMIEECGLNGIPVLFSDDYKPETNWFAERINDILQERQLETVQLAATSSLHRVD